MTAFLKNVGGNSALDTIRNQLEIPPGVELVEYVAAHKHCVKIKGDKVHLVADLTGANAPAGGLDHGP